MAMTMTSVMMILNYDDHDDDDNDVGYEVGDVGDGMDSPDKVQWSNLCALRHLERLHTPQPDINAHQ